MNVWHRKSATNRWYSICFLTSLLLCPFSAFAQDSVPHGGSEIIPENNLIAINLYKGTLLRLARPASDIIIANPSIADVQVKSPHLIYILAKEVGETTLYAMDDSDTPIYSATIQVLQNEQVQRDMSEMLRDYENDIEAIVPGTSIKISPFGKMFIIDGTVQSPEQAELVIKLCEPLVTTNPIETMQSMEKKDSADMAMLALQYDSAVKSKNNDKRQNLINRLVIMQPTQVNLRVKFAEISRTTLKELGISWENGFSSGGAFFGIATGRDVFQDVSDSVFNVPVREYFTGGTESGNLFGGFLSNSLDLNYMIDAMDNEGFLSVLAEPNLTAISGQTGSFLAGGEFPIPVPQRDSVTIAFRQFGVQLVYTPTVLNNGRINLYVKPEVSDLSNAGSVQIAGTSIPSISTRAVETTVELGSGQSFAIAGLLENKVVQDNTKLPGFGDLPILGALFRSDKFRRNETELLVVITPYLVKPVDDRRIALPTDGYIAPSDMERYLKGQKWHPSVSQKTPGDILKNTGPTLKGRAGFQLK